MSRPTSLAQHYQKVRVLSRHPTNGSKTYLARDRQTNQWVAIAYFPADTESVNRNAYEREITALRRLQHPGIPRYIAAFEVSRGFCLVREYQAAAPLAPEKAWTPAEVKFAARAILEILIYLQTCEPPVIHRNLQPSAILVDELLNFYLTDFALARIGTGTATFGSTTAGTFGFMAPEQLHNQPLSPRTDLYSLGMTLFCLLTQTPAAQIERALDERGRLPVRDRLPDLNPQFSAWLEQLVALQPEARFADARAARAALQAIDVASLPRLQIEPASVTLTGQQLGETLETEITVTNTRPETSLRGQWHLERTAGDRGEAWLQIHPTRLTDNQVTCRITARTQPLLAQQTYHRQLCFSSNAESAVQPLTVTVETGRLGLSPRQMLYKAIAAQALALWVAALAAIVELPAIVPRLFDLLPANAIAPRWQVLLGGLLILATSFWLWLGYAFSVKRGLASLLIGGFISLFSVAVTVSLLRWLEVARLAGSLLGRPGEPLSVPVLAAVLAIASGAWLLIGSLAGFLAYEYRRAEFELSMARLLAVLGTATAVSLGSVLTDFRTIALVLLFGPVLALMLSLALQKRYRQQQAYQHSVPRRVQP